jgi:gamma-glutamylcyclotransferase (GGCT)/AIG2-like uncharacterized protein YtfP
MLERNLYFAYGANMHPGQMAWRCPNARAHGAFVLRDWELKLYSHATIEPKTGSTVSGVLWDITDECEDSLDRFEGFPSYYTKQTWIQDNTQFFFYEMTTPKSGKPSEGYVLDIRDSYDFWGIPRQHLAPPLNDTIA